MKRTFWLIPCQKTNVWKIKVIFQTETWKEAWNRFLFEIYSHRYISRDYKERFYLEGYANFFLEGKMEVVIKEARSAIEKFLEDEKIRKSERDKDNLHRNQEPRYLYEDRVEMKKR